MIEKHLKQKQEIDAKNNESLTTEREEQTAKGRAKKKQMRPKQAIDGAIQILRLM